MGVQPIRKTVVPEIPDKLYFRIGDVARLCEVPAYVLRFWETEFPQLKPNKGGTGQRLYRRRDVEMALRIKSLLYDQGYTIPGARQVFKNEIKPEPRQESRAAAEAAPEAVRPPEPVAASMATPAIAREHGERLRLLRAEMVSLLDLLSRPVGAAGDPHRGLKAVPSPDPVAAQAARRPRLVESRLLSVEPARREQGDLFSLNPAGLEGSGPGQSPDGR